MSSVSDKFKLLDVQRKRPQRFMPSGCRAASELDVLALLFFIALLTRSTQRHVRE